MNTTKQAVTSGFLWRFLERCGAQGVTFIVSIILARILEPTVYGTVALINVFITILSVFVDSGMGSALIQKKDADDTDFSTMFYFNLVMCFSLYFILFITAPYIESFYKIDGLTPIIRVLGITLIISGLKNIQQAYVSRNIMFKKFFFATLSGTIGAGIVGILMAYNGFGVWAIVTQSIFNNIVDTLILWLSVKWRPKKLFSFSRLRSLFNFGWKLLISSLIDTVDNKLRQLIIGKNYSASDLAFYNKGASLPELVINNVCTSINSVLFPVMSNKQDNRIALKNMTRQSIKVSTYIIMPLMMGLAVCSKPLISLLLTDKWLPAVFYLRIFCFTYALYPIHIVNLNAIKAIGKSDLFLKLEIIKKVVGIIALLLTMWVSVKAMAYSLLFTSVISQIINTRPNKRLINYGYLEQLKDISPAIILSVITGCLIYPIQMIGLSNILTLCIQVSLGIIIYIIGSKVAKIETYSYLIGILKSFSKKTFKKSKQNIN